MQILIDVFYLIVKASHEDVYTNGELWSLMNTI